MHCGRFMNLFQNFDKNWDFWWISLILPYVLLVKMKGVDFDENLWKKWKKLKTGSNIVKNVRENEGFETLESQKNFEENEWKQYKNIWFLKRNKKLIYHTYHLRQCSLQCLYFRFAMIIAILIFERCRSVKTWKLEHVITCLHVYVPPSPSSQ